MSAHPPVGDEAGRIVFVAIDTCLRLGADFFHRHARNVQIRRRGSKQHKLKEEWHKCEDGHGCTLSESIGKDVHIVDGERLNTTGVISHIFCMNAKNYEMTPEEKSGSPSTVR